MFSPVLTEPELEPATELDLVPLTEFEFEHDTILDLMSLSSELITLSSNKLSSILFFLLIWSDDYDPFLVFLSKTFLIKWGFVAVHSHQTHA